MKLFCVEISTFWHFMVYAESQEEVEKYLKLKDYTWKNIYDTKFSHVKDLPRRKQ